MPNGNLEVVIMNQFNVHVQSISCKAFFFFFFDKENFDEMPGVWEDTSAEGARTTGRRIPSLLHGCGSRKSLWDFLDSTFEDMKTFFDCGQERKFKCRHWRFFLAALKPAGERHIPVSSLTWRVVSMLYMNAWQKHLEEHMVN